MQVVVDVYRENIPVETKKKTKEAFLTFVAVDLSGRPIEIAKSIAENDSEIELYSGTIRRRQLRLAIAGRMKPEDATELKAIFKI